MEAQPDNSYGESLRADIPRLEIKNLNIKYSMSPSCFSRMPLTLSAPQSEEPDRGDALNHVIQTDPQVRLIVEANEAIILMINSFVDFFIQYYCIGYTRELNPLILILKEIIFNSTTNESESFTASGYDELLHTILSTNVKMHQWVVESSDSELYFFPKNVGRQLLYDDPDVVPVAYTDLGADAVDEHAVLIESRFIASKKKLEKKLEDITQSFFPHATQEFHRKQLQEEADAIKLYLDDKLFTISTTSKFQKFEIFYLLFLSYHVLSMSGFFFYIEIQDLDEILRQEIARGKPNSFILEFLPYDESKVAESRTVINIIKSQLSTFFFNKNDKYFMPSLRGLQLRAGTMPALQRLIRRAADAGGSKRFNNKSRKNKYKHKYNYKYKKSRKNKRHRRKRTQSTQNKMF